MDVIAKHTKVLGNMSKGRVDFNAAAAREAADAIARQATKMPGMFEINADDPKSEALPVIWTEFDDFGAKADELRGVSITASARISTRKDLRTALGKIGGACQSCHQTFRK